MRAKIKKSLLVSLAMIFSSATPIMAAWWSEPVIFEATYYADQNPGVREQVGYDEVKLINHWGKFGLPEGRRSSPVFDVKYYLKHNPDIANAIGKNNYAKAADHWYKNGRKEGRPSHPDFDVKRYLEINKDVARRYGQHNYLKAIDHYLTIGYQQGRKGK